MKKTILFFIVLFFLAFQGRPQGDKTNQVQVETKLTEATGLYLKADLGFAFGTHSEIYNQNTTTTGSETTNRVTDAVKVRFGTGLPVEVAAGYMFNKNFGVELGIDYFKGFNTKILNTVNGDQSKTLLSAVHLSVIPTIRAQFQAGNVIPYVQMGVDVSVMNQVNTYVTGVTYLFKASQTGTLKQKDYGGITVGIKAAAGVEFPLSELISIFGQIQAEQLSYTPKHGKVTKYEVEGEDMLSSLTTRQSKWDYVKSINSSDPTPADEANKVLRVTHSFDNVGIVVGVKFKFGKNG